MKKVPWGILAGTCMIVAFFAVVGTVGAYIALNAIASLTSATATLFDQWYQVVLFAVDIVSVIGLAFSLTMYAIHAKSKNKGDSQ